MDGKPPIPNSYHVPGATLIAGEYPGAPTLTEALEKLNALLDAEVRLFLDLTQERELRPYTPWLTEEAERRGASVTHIRRSIRDMDVCDADAMAEILDLIDAELAEQRTVYVHCWGGVGRTGTVVGCHLVRRGYAPEDALAEVGRLFATMSPSKLRWHPEGSPQTDAQRDFVRRWAECDPTLRGDGKSA